MMIDNATSVSGYSRPVVTEYQTDLNQIFRGLRRRPRPELAEEQARPASFDRYRKTLRINNDSLRDTQSALQVFHELHTQGQAAYQLVSQLQQVVTQLAQNGLTSEKRQELLSHAQDLKKQLHQQPLPEQSSLQALMTKFDPEQGLSAPVTVGGVPVHPERFELLLADITFESAESNQTQQQLTQFGDRLQGFMAYVEALKSRMHSKLKMLDKKAPAEFQRVESFNEARQLAKKTGDMIVSQSQVAVESQANLLSSNTQTLLNAA